MTELQPRSVKDENTVTGRTVIRLSPAEWAMVEEVADYEGITWREWVERVMTENIAEGLGKTRTSLVRQKAEASYKALLDIQTQQVSKQSGKGNRVRDSHPMLKGFYALGDEPFLIEMQSARIVFSVSGGGYVFHAGYRAREFGGEPALFIEDKHRGGAHIILTEGKKS